ncbi:AraC family transcriptional regulator [Clostridium grantii]
MKDLKLKTYEVAGRVGINDARYFSQLFRKHTGVTPSKFRSSMKEGL